MIYNSVNDVKKMMIDITTNCQALCPGCQRTRGGTKEHPVNPTLTTGQNDWPLGGNMSFDIFKKALPVELISGDMEHVNFTGNFGEPTFHPQFKEFVQYLYDNKGPYLVIDVSTNGGLHTPEWWVDFAKMHKKFANEYKKQNWKRNLITFAIDGIDDETQQKYRRGVNYDKAMTNARAFIDAGGNAEWQFIAFKHNEHQIEEAKKLAKEYGFKELSTSRTRSVFNAIDDISHRKGKREIEANETKKHKKEKLIQIDKFLEIVEANLVSKGQLEIITANIDKKIYEGTDADLMDGPPCLADISKISNKEGFDGKDRFMYNYHVFAKMKYPDGWEQKVKNAPVKFFEERHANAWDDKILGSKLKSWKRSDKGYTCTQSPLSDFCKKGICVKKRFGVLAGSKGSYPVLTNLRKIEIFEEPEYEFDVTKPDGIGKATVHCRSVEHLNDQRKRRNAISKAAGFLPPLIKGDREQMVMDELYKTQTKVQPPIGTSPREKLHDVLHAKINGPRATNDAAFKTGSVFIEGEYAFFKFEKLYDRLKAKDWKY